MKLEKLTLTNFRGFDQIELNLDPELTVIAGVNGIGKSSLLSATATVASHLLPVISQAKSQILELTNDDVHSGKPALTIGALWATSGGPFHAQVVRSVSDPTKVEEYQKRRDEVRFAMRQVKKDSDEEAALVEEIRFLDELLRPDKDHFSYQCEGIASTYLARIRSHPAEPLVIHYSTERYFRGMPKKLLEVKPLSPADAHTDALAGKEVKLNDFANWFRFVQTGKNAKFGKLLLAMLDEAISKMLPGFSKLQLVQGSMPHFTIVKAGEILKLGQLSDGEQGLLALVFDLTRRLAIANPKSKNPLAEGEVVVLIDEIELHLHPKWQRQVLRHLLEVFPSCQFIITTHSALVLGEVEASKIYFLETQKKGGRVVGRTPLEAYGLDANRVLDELMGTPERNLEIDKKLRRLFLLIDQEKFPAAKKQISSLVKRLGINDPEITRANALIKFLGGDE